MVKKIKKYLKFALCCTLIMSLVAPSYAALSASDGSAFVTKAEFDAALADFNSRLTTFEAGINSKIDSQVTSYLDRNGIWNGKTQDINVLYSRGLMVNTADMVDQTAGLSWSATTETKNYYVLNGFDGSTKTKSKTAYYLFPNRILGGREYDIVKTISKSGLMMVPYVVRFEGGV